LRSVVGARESVIKRTLSHDATMNGLTRALNLESAWLTERLSHTHDGDPEGHSVVATGRSRA
jgi:hypothetical protein